MNREQLIDLDKKQLGLLKKILKQHIPNNTVWAYGSRVTWKANEISDLDLAVFECNSTQISSLKEELEESDLLISVDVMDWESIPEKFKENIKKKYVVLQEKTKLEGWREVKLGDIADIFTGRKDVNQTNPKGSYRFFSCSPDEFFSDEYICDNKALIITGNSSYTGTVRFFSGKFDLYQRTYACVLIDKYNDRFDTKFIFYYAKHFFEREYMGGTRGSSIPYIVRGDIENFTVPAAPLAEQKAIAEVLSSLDDKIDLLHRQNKTLENIAQTLFRQWFVEDADEGWEEGKLGDVFTVKGGATPSTKTTEYWNGNISWATPKDLSNNSAVFLCETERKITSAGLAKISSGLLPVGTVLLSSRAPIGYLAISNIAVAINQGYIAILCDKILSNCFVYLWCKNNIEMIKNHGSGSVSQEISKSVFRALDIIIPPNKNLSFFDQVIEPFFLKIKHNQSQIRTLENLRDTFLPKLMSGTVRVKSRR